jgi:hypothetical protein
MSVRLTVAGLLLAGPSLVSCGGDDSGAAADSQDGRSPAAVSVEQFCGAAEEFENLFGELDVENPGDDVAALKDAAQELKDLGTPDGIPDDAREGLVLTLDKLIDLPDDATADDLDAVFAFDEQEHAASMAFEAYLDDHCDYRTDSSS